MGAFKGNTFAQVLFSDQGEAIAYNSFMLTREPRCWIYPTGKIRPYKQLAIFVKNMDPSRDITEGTDEDGG